jgi:hypothetical protein
MTEPTRRAVAEIATAHASKYLQQLCKHFQHKLPASFDATSGSITFPSGEAKLAADAQRLTLTVSVQSDDDLANLKDVVARHLQRFAFKEELDVAWREAV